MPDEEHDHFDDLFEEVDSDQLPHPKAAAFIESVDSPLVANATGEAHEWMEEPLTPEPAVESMTEIAVGEKACADLKRRVDEAALTDTVLPPRYFEEDAAAPPVKIDETRWVCSGPGCYATWKKNPGSFHTHETPVPGSKSRVTYKNYPITRVG